jgi:enoyl-CoA hydratase
MFTQLDLKIEKHTAIATIQRPEAMNALNTSVLGSLSQCLDFVTADLANKREIRALVITGSGEKAFVAGADIKQFDEMQAAHAAEFATRGQALFSRLAALPIPVIAAVNGFALGGGLELAMACDFIYASENAKFALPECTLGLIPGYGGTVRLAERVGVARALEMAMTGSMMTSDEALRVGLVNRVVAREQLMPTVLEQCDLLATRAPLALALIKQSVRASRSLTEHAAFELEASLFGKAFQTADRAIGVRAFIEKRKPEFTGL